jgi:hypothetical protein
MSATPTTPEQILFPTRISPIGVFFVIVSSLTIAFALVTFLSTRLPIPLMVLLFAVVGCCAVLLRNAIEEMAAVTIEWSSQGVTCRRLLGSVSYYWSHIERVELYDPGATFGDFGRHEGGRSAIGLYLRDAAKANKPASDVPDVMLVSRVGEAAEKIPKLADRLSNAKRFGGGRDSRKIGGVAPAASPPRAGKQFRRSAAAKKASAA